MDIVVTGSIAYDYIMRFPGKFSEHILLENLENLDLSFHVHDMRRHWGGTGANIAYMLGLLGEHPKLVAAAGHDFEEFRHWLDAVGVDTSTVREFEDVHTSSFFATTDEAHHQIASFYGGSMDRNPEVTLADTVQGEAGIVTISANHFEAMLNYVRECKQFGIPYMYDPGWNIIRMTPEDMRESVDGAKVVAVNGYELEMLLSKTGLSQDELTAGAESVLVTRGKEGADILHGDRKIHIPSVPNVEVNDPTGAGDSFRSGFLKGLAHEWSLELSGRLGALCAAFTIEAPGPQSASFTLNEYVQRFREAFPDFDADGALDSLTE